MNCLIIEDQPPAQRILKKYIADAGNLILLATYTDALQALELLKTGTVDLIFLDIHLPKLSGVDFLKTLPNPPKVILTTAFSDYAIESYELNVVDYLLKPFSFPRFVQAVAKVQLLHPEPETNKLALVEPEVLYVKSGYELLKVVVNDILYIQTDADYTELFTSERKYLSAEPLRHWSDTLPSHRFVQVHKSFVVNTAYISRVKGSSVYLENTTTTIPIGRAYKEAFLKMIMN